MKKLIIVLAAIIAGVSSYAQSAAELKNEGNAALKTKDYKTALAKYEAYLATGEEGVAGDKATIYNIATCADKLDNSEKAIEYYQKAIDMDYRGDISTYKIAKIYQDKGDDAAYIAKIDEAYTTYSSSKYRKTFLAILTKHYNKIAAEPYNAGNAAYNEGAASGDVVTYKVKVKEAIKLYEEAKTAFAKTLEYDENDAMAKSAIANMESNIQAYEDYIKSIQ